MLEQIRKGRKNTQLQCIEGIWRKIHSDVGLFQRSDLVAILFIIYLEDMMKAFQALNDKHGLPPRIKIHNLLKQRTGTPYKNDHYKRKKTTNAIT